MASNDFLFFLGECHRKNTRWEKLHNAMLYEACPECGRHADHEQGCPMETWLDKVQPIADAVIVEELYHIDSEEQYHADMKAEYEQAQQDEFAKAEWHIDCHVCGVTIAYCHCDEIFRDDQDVLASIRADHKLAITDWNNKLIGK